MLPDTHNMHIAAFFKTLLSRKATGVSGGQNYCLTNCYVWLFWLFLFIIFLGFFFSGHVMLVWSTYSRSNTVKRMWTKEEGRYILFSGDNGIKQ